MSRTLKFRVWIKSAKQWQTQENVEWTPIREIMGKGNVDDYVWMQFTGLFSKSGKEIYEGDILRFFYDGEEFHTGPVSWREEFAIWGSAFMLTQIEPEDLWVKECEYEVIGNIYENPELLKEGV